jgi:cytochrome oxidase Cu insertion factor (SCO1/SenC/PrrC family)
LIALRSLRDCFLLWRLARVLAGHVLCLLLVAPNSVASERQDVAGPIYPDAGTYKLQKIQQVPSAWVLEDSVWLPRRLSSYTSGKITLFSFFYGACRDPQGCPAAWAAFQAVHDAVKSDPKLRNKVRLVFLSLDPKVDTPAMLSFYNTSLNTPEAQWAFLTTWSEAYLAPILEQMYVPAAREQDESGKPTDVINHLLKVFLIDKNSWVREIYTTNFLNPDVILSDIRTLLQEEG